MTDQAGRLYDDLSYLWPTMSAPGDYAAEAAYWKRELRRGLGPGRHRVLDLGAGGGHLLHHLAGELEATAVDLSSGMLDHSRKLNPGVRHHVGDMRTVRLRETFDAVLIHDAVDYMATETDLLAAFATARAHLRAGGLLITAPDHYTETFISPSFHHETHRNGGLDLTYVEYSTDLDPSDTQLETAYVFFVREGRELRVEVDRHLTGLFPIATWDRLLREAGFEPERIDYPVGEQGEPMFLWVGRLN